MKLKGLCTATIGSFPLDDSEKNRSRILDDLVNLEIDFPNYPQLVDMGRQFLDDINKGLYPPGVESFDWTVSYIEEKGMRDEVKLKACLSGPFTLAFYVKTENSNTIFSNNTVFVDRENVEEFTDILSGTCKAFGKRAKMVFIDEPILSLIVGRRILSDYTENDVIQFYNKMKNACGDVYVGTHVCGRIQPLLAETLLKTDLDILSHEFYGTSENFEVYKRRELEARDKMLAMGCLSTIEQRVESVEEIRSLMKKSRNKFGDNLIFTPDCGFRSLIVEGSKEKGYQIAIQKLRNMKKALHEVYD